MTLGSHLEIKDVLPLVFAKDHCAICPANGTILPDDLSKLDPASTMPIRIACEVRRAMATCQIRDALSIFQNVQGTFGTTPACSPCADASKLTAETLAAAAILEY